MAEQNSITSSKPGFKFTKLHLLIITIIIIVGVSLIYYYFEYKNHHIAYLFVIILFVAYVTLVMVIGGRYLDAPKIRWQDDKTGMLKQGFGRLFIYLISMAIAFGYGFSVYKMEEKRENDIMTTQPTAITTALVTGIDISHGRSGIYYDAELRYTVNGKTIFQQTPDNSGYFKAGETYTLKYSVQYPEMFIIYGK